jgi:hypothetical protein
MKLSGILIVALAISIGVVPLFYTCESAGNLLTLENGRQVPMKCTWTARAAALTGGPLLVAGLMMGFSRKREALRSSTIMAAVLGIGAILLPTVLIGVCQHPGAPCNMVLKPALILMGSLTAGISLVSLVISERRTELFS